MQLLAARAQQNPHRLPPHPCTTDGARLQQESDPSGLHPALPFPGKNVSRLGVQTIAPRMFSFVPTGRDVQSVNRNRPYTTTGTSFLEAFKSCRLMKFGARRRMTARCLDYSGWTSSVAAFNNA